MLEPLQQKEKNGEIPSLFEADEIIATLGEALLVIDREGLVRVANKTACCLFGLSHPELIGKPIAAIGDGLFPPDQLQLSFRTGTLQRYERTYTPSSGRPVALDVSISAIRGRPGVVEGIVCTARDLTGRTAAEEALRRAHAELRRSHEELKAAQLQLIQVEKMESVGRLAAGVAHEVKNPLAIILQGIDYFSKRLDATEQDRLALHYMQEAARRANVVIRGLVDFSTSKSLELREEEINAIAEESLLLVKHELDKNRIHIIKHLGNPLPSVRLDKNKIEQVFVNIFMNAVQAMPREGTLILKTMVKQLNHPSTFVGRRVTDRFAIGDWAVVVEVEDNGSGIPEDIMPKIFDPFFTTKPTGKGTGLGLTVTKSIVELHGGVMEVVNRPEGGVKVTFMLKAEGVNDDK